MHRHLNTLLAGALITALSGCGFGNCNYHEIDNPPPKEGVNEGDVGIEDPQSNIAITEISTGPLDVLEPNSTFRAYYDVHVKGFDDIDVDVHFYLIHAAELDEETDDEVEIDEVHKVGAFELSQVSEGSHSFETEITIPNDLIGGH